jgi:hypothetical protein
MNSEEKQALCIALCGKEEGLARAACEAECEVGPDDALWHYAQHIAWHRYKLTGEQGRIFSIAFVLAYKDKQAK